MNKAWLSDVRGLWVPILVLTIGVVVAMVLLSLARKYQYVQTDAWQQASNARNKAQQTLQLAKQERAVILQYLPQYTQLKKLGFLNTNYQQQWVNQLTRIQKQHHLLPIDYEIAYPKPYPTRLIDKASHYQLQHSVVTLNMQLLHAGELVKLLQNLRHDMPPFLLRDCEISREVHVGKIKQPKLTGRCVMELFMLDTIIEGSS